MAVQLTPAQRKRALKLYAEARRLAGKLGLEGATLKAGAFFRDSGCDRTVTRKQPAGDRAARKRRSA